MKTKLYEMQCASQAKAIRILIMQPIGLMHVVAGGKATHSSMHGILLRVLYSTYFRERRELEIEVIVVISPRGLRI